MMSPVRRTPVPRTPVLGTKNAKTNQPSVNHRTAVPKSARTVVLTKEMI